MITVKSTSTFSSRCTCDQLRSALAECSKSGLHTKAILLQRQNNLEIIALERRWSQRKKKDAMRNPGSLYSIIIYRTDRAAFRLVCFITKTMKMCGRSTKIRLVSLLEHCAVKHCLSIFMLTEEYETGANYVAKAIQEFFNACRISTACFPQNSYVQKDNCNSEQYVHIWMLWIPCSLERVGWRCRFVLANWLYWQGHRLDFFVHLPSPTWDQRNLVFSFTAWARLHVQLVYSSYFDAEYGQILWSFYK